MPACTATVSLAHARAHTSTHADRARSHTHTYTSRRYGHPHTLLQSFAGVRRGQPARAARAGCAVRTCVLRVIRTRLSGGSDKDLRFAEDSDASETR